MAFAPERVVLDSKPSFVQHALNASLSPRSPTSPTRQSSKEFSTSLRQRIRELEQENSQLQPLRERMVELSDQNRRLSTALAQLEELEREKTYQVQFWRQRAEKSDNSVDEAQQTHTLRILASAKNQVDAKEKEIQQLKSTVEQLRAECEVLESRTEAVSIQKAP